MKLDNVARPLLEQKSGKEEGKDFRHLHESRVYARKHGDPRFLSSSIYDHRDFRQPFLTDPASIG